MVFLQKQTFIPTFPILNIYSPLLCYFFLARMLYFLSDTIEIYLSTLPCI